MAHSVLIGTDLNALQKQRDPARTGSLKKGGSYHFQRDPPRAGDGTPRKNSHFNPKNNRTKPRSSRPEYCPHSRGNTGDTG